MSNQFTFPHKHSFTIGPVELYFEIDFLRSEYYLIIPQDIVKIAHPSFIASPREYDLYPQFEVKHDESMVLNLLLTRIESAVNDALLRHVSELSDKQIVNTFLNVVSKQVSASKRFVAKMSYSTTAKPFKVN